MKHGKFLQVSKSNFSKQAKAEAAKTAQAQANVDAKAKVEAACTGNPTSVPWYVETMSPR